MGDLEEAGSRRKPPQRQDSVLQNFGKELLAGGAAGACGKSSVAPLERVKILIQVCSRATQPALMSTVMYLYPQILAI